MQSLTQRQLKILKKIVELYLQGVPEISSLMLTSLNLFNVSSATLRNELTVLTNSGYLKKTHYAAGRIPTLQALQLYINLLNKEQSAQSNITKLYNDLQITNNIYDILIQIINILSRLNNHTVFITFKNNTFLRNLKNLAKSLDNLYKKDSNSYLSILNYVIDMLENTNVLRHKLQDYYAVFNLQTVATLPIEFKSQQQNDLFLISYAPFKIKQESLEFIGIIGRPDIQYIETIPLIKELASILSTI